MSVKYYTRDSALAAVTSNGMALSSVATYLRDDFEIVLAAISNGGTLLNASFRLQNHTPLIIVSEWYNSKVSSPFAVDYPTVLFCAKHDKELLKFYAEKYKDWDEFIIEMKLFYGSEFISPITKYNVMSADELKKELQFIRMQLVNDCRVLYSRAYSIYDLDRNSKLSKAIRHNILRWNLTGYNEIRKPFSDIIESLEKEIAKVEKERHRYALTTGGSYPERFISAVLSNLGISFYREQIFPWSKNTSYGTKRYDFYVPSKNMIIEVHGLQHYDGGFEGLGGRSLADEQNNDRFKEQLAKSNGISSYIIINAAASSFDFISNSIISNTEFCNYFDVNSIDWYSVNAEVLHNDILIESPLLKEKIDYYKMLIDLFKVYLKSSDYRLPKNTVRALSKNEKNIRSSFPSKNGLFPHEIVLLERIPSYEVNNIPDWVQDKWCSYFDSKISEYMQKFINLGLIQYVSTANVLDRITVPELRRCLADYGKITNGKKIDLITRIKHELTEKQINTSIPPRFCELTSLGVDELQSNSFLFYADQVGLTIWEANQIYYEHKAEIDKEFKPLQRQLSRPVSSNPNLVEWYNISLIKYLRGIKTRKTKMPR